MKKIIVMTVMVALLLSSCGTYTSTGAYTGAQFGHIIGSAIGGISGGGRGHDIGSLIGTVGGAAAGAAIGSAADNARQKKFDSYAQQQQQQYAQPQQHYAPGGAGGHASIVIRHANVIDQSGDGVLARGEEMQLSFDIFNHSDAPVYHVYPVVEDVTGNRHVHISPNLRIESIGPRQGVRYTARIVGDRSLRDGEIVVRMGVSQNGRDYVSEVKELRVRTTKRKYY